jgi:hypothetical protein
MAYTRTWILEPSVYIEWLWDRVTSLCHRLLQRLASSIELRCFSWDVDPANETAIPSAATVNLQEPLGTMPLMWTSTHIVYGGIIVVANDGRIAHVDEIWYKQLLGGGRGIMVLAAAAAAAGFVEVAAPVVAVVFFLGGMSLLLLLAVAASSTASSTALSMALSSLSSSSPLATSSSKQRRGQGGTRQSVI